MVDFAPTGHSLLVSPHHDYPRRIHLHIRSDKCTGCGGEREIQGPVPGTYRQARDFEDEGSKGR